MAYDQTAADLLRENEALKKDADDMATMDLERVTSRQWLMGRDGVKRLADTNEPVESRPRCAVGGRVRPGAMCGEVIVGGEFCGHVGECQHKVTPNA